MNKFIVLCAIIANALTVQAQESANAVAMNEAGSTLAGFKGAEGESHRYLMSEDFEDDEDEENLAEDEEDFDEEDFAEDDEDFDEEDVEEVDDENIEDDEEDMDEEDLAEDDEDIDEEDLAEADDFDEEDLEDDEGEDLEEVDGDFDEEDADEDLVDENLGAACHRSKKVKTTTSSKVIRKFIASLDKIMKSSRSKPGKRRSALGLVRRTRRRNRKNMKKSKISKVGGKAVRSFLRDIRRSIENTPNRRLTSARINRKARIAARKARRNKSRKEKKQAKKAANKSIKKNRRYTERSFVRVVKRAFKRYISKNGTKPEGCRRSKSKTITNAQAMALVKTLISDLRDIRRRGKITAVGFNKTYKTLSRLNTKLRKEEKPISTRKSRKLIRDANKSSN